MLQTSKQFPSKTTIDELNDVNDNGQHLFDSNAHAPNEDMAVESNKNPIINKRTLLKSDRAINEIKSDFVDTGDSKVLQANELDMGGRMENVDNKYVAIEDEAENSVNASDRVTDNLILEKMKYAVNNDIKFKNNEQHIQADLYSRHQSTEGRIVVYGDSNCLDSTHIEKPCFWLLDALLQYTMTSHVSTLLKDLNRAPNMQFDATTKKMPKRLPNNNLHLYSKVLLPISNNENGLTDDGATNLAYIKPLKRTNPVCIPLQWEKPIYLNITTPTDFLQFNGANRDDSDADVLNMVGELNLRRKLESQKGEVRSETYSMDNFSE